MATPRLNLSRISEPGQVFQESVSNAGMVGRATANLGQQLMQTGVQVGNLLERRNAEEARDQVQKAKAQDKIQAKLEEAELQEKYANDPTNYQKALIKQRGKRRSQLLRNVTNPDARDSLQQDFTNRIELEMLDAKLFADKQFKVNSTNSIQSIGKEKATADLSAPTSPQEFMLDLGEDVLDIQNRDIYTDAEKAELIKGYSKSRLDGIVAGYVEGGSDADYMRANAVIQQMGEQGYITPTEVTNRKQRLLNTQINRENIRIRNEKLQRQEDEARFEATRTSMSDIFAQVSESPDMDIQDSMDFLKSQGYIDVDNPTVIPAQKMSPIQQTVSNAIKYEIMDKVAESSNPAQLQDEVYNAVFSGQMSAEDGQQAINSIRTFSDKKFSKEARSNSNKIIRDLLNTGNFMEPKIDREEENRLRVMRDDLVSEFGIDISLATNVVLKTESLGRYTPAKVSALTSDVSTLEGIENGFSELKEKVDRGELTKREAGAILKKLNDNKMLLQSTDGVPTIEELRKQRGSN